MARLVSFCLGLAAFAFVGVVIAQSLDERGWASHFVSSSTAGFGFARRTAHFNPLANLPAAYFAFCALFGWLAARVLRQDAFGMPLNSLISASSIAALLFGMQFMASDLKALVSWPAMLSLASAASCIGLIGARAMQIWLAHGVLRMSDKRPQQAREIQRAFEMRRSVTAAAGTRRRAHGAQGNPVDRLPAFKR